MKLRLPLAMLTGLLGLSLVVQEPLSGQIGLQEVTSVRFEGNREFPDEALSRAIITRETECRSIFCMAGADFSLDPYFLNERVLVEDFVRIHLFYIQNGFREVVVDTLISHTEEGEVEITFQIQEGDPIRIVEINFPGVEALPDSSVLEGLPIHPTEPLSLHSLDATRDTLETRLKNQGYAHAEVFLDYFVPRETPYAAQVTFDIDPGPLTRFGPVTVRFVESQGREPSVDEAVVLRMLPFREGDLYQEDLKFAAQRSLYNLDIFRNVGFDTTTASRDEEDLPLTVVVEEGDVHRVRTGGGFSTAECFDFEASWSSRNFIGGARRLQVTGRLANVFAPFLERTLCPTEEGSEEYRDLIGSISVDFTQPWFYSPRNSISARLFAERQSYPGVFVREALGMSLGFTRILAPSTFLGLSYRPQLSRLKLTDVLFCSAYLICSQAETEILREENFLSPVGISFSRDRRDQVLSPTQGYSFAVDFEHARKWTGSEFGYSRMLSEITWHTRPDDRLVVGAHLRGGWVGSEGFESFGEGGLSGDVLHPEKRLFAGGANSVRGFPQNRLGPRVLFLEDPDQLVLPRQRGEDLLPPLCTLNEVEDLSCDAGLLADGKFLPRPKGGTRLLEGSVEVRFPFAGPLWEGASFLDFGQVWDEEVSPALADLELTPGFGVRYFSPIGPIRVDVGYRFGGGEKLPVVTKKILLRPEEVPSFVFSEDDLVVLGNPVLWGDELDRWTLRRFQLHLSIGQAF